MKGKDKSNDMIEFNGFALLGRNEIQLITRNDQENYFWLPLHSLNYEEIEKMRKAIQKNNCPNYNKIITALKKRLSADTLYEVKEKALLFSMLADVCTDDKWEQKLIFIDRQGKNDSAIKENFLQKSTEEILFLDKEKLDWIKKFSTQLQHFFDRQERKQLSSLFQSLSELYYEKYEKQLKYSNLLSFPGSFNKLPKDKNNPWIAKGYYKVKTDPRGRIIANWKGEILLEYVQPVKPLDISNFFLKLINPRKKKTEISQQTQKFFNAMDLFCGEIVGGINNFFENYFTAVSHKEIKDPYAKAFALFYWSLKDFLESRTGNYSSNKDLIFDYRLKRILHLLALKEKLSSFELEMNEIEMKENEKIKDLFQKGIIVKEPLCSTHFCHSQQSDSKRKKDYEK